MLRLEIEVAATDTARRLIEGVAVPYGEVAEVMGQSYTFAPMSLRRARETTPLLLGHDTNQPVGVLTELSDGPEGARVRFRVDRTLEGDRALEQARSGSRGGLSIGFEIDRSRESGDALEILEASLYEVSLVAVPAFASARVERVAAERGSEDDREDDAGESGDDDAAGAEDLPPAAEGEDDAGAAGDDDETEGEDGAMPNEQESLDTGGADRRPVIRAERSSRAPALRAGEFVQTLIRAEHGDVAAQRLLQAALSAVTSANAPGVLPPTYTTEILGGVDADRTLADLFRSSSPLPSTGLTITKPKWTTKPQGGWIADGAATPSTAVQIDAVDSQIEQWAYGVLVSYAVMERSSPDFAEAVYREAVNDYYGDVETKLAAELAAIATAPAASLGAAVAAYVAARRSRPNVLLVGGTVYGEFVDATGPGYPLYTTGAVDASGNVAEYIAGLRLVLASFLAPTAALVGHTSAIDFREQNPIRLSANVIGTNSVEIGVYSFAYFDTEKPDAFVPITYVPPVAGTASAGRSSRSS